MIRSIDFATIPLVFRAGRAAAPAAGAGRLASDVVSVNPRPRDLTGYARFLEDQGNTNGCGTTSLGSIMSYWQNQPGSHTRRKLDQVCRAGDNTTSIHRLLSYANDHGMRAGAKNHASLADLRRYTDLGCPVQVLIEPKSGKDGMLHYVTVIGVDTDARGNVTGVKLADPDGGAIKTLPAAKFEQRWSDLALWGVGTGIDRVMLVHLPETPVTVRGRDGKLRSTADIAVPKGRGLGFRAFLGHLVLETKNLWIRAFG